MEASEIKAAREQLILKRSQIIKELRTRGDQWREFEQVCREIVELDRKLERQFGDGQVLGQGDDRAV